jgi:hypothetical protein
MSTNQLYQVIVDAMTNTGCQQAFNQGLYLGAIFVAGAIAFYMIRQIPCGDKEGE